MDRKDELRWLREKIFKAVDRHEGMILYPQVVDIITDEILSLIPPTLSQEEVEDLLWKQSNPLSLHPESLGVIFEQDFKELSQALSGRIAKGECVCDKCADICKDTHKRRTECCLFKPLPSEFEKVAEINWDNLDVVRVDPDKRAFPQAIQSAINELRRNQQLLIRNQDKIIDKLNQPTK